MESIIENDSLTVTDNRTGKIFTIPVSNNSILAANVMKETNSRMYDPGALHTAICTSSISSVDSKKGILRYRGYDIAELFEKSTFLEVAYLLIEGELPMEEQLKEWKYQIMHHTFVHENTLQLLKTFRYDAHPMGQLISCISALSTFHSDANPALHGTDLYNDTNVCNKQIYRILGKLPTISACAYRHRIGRPYNYPNTSADMSYTENFLYMLDRLSENDYKPSKQLAKILDKLFILHAEHELNCATVQMRHLSSSRVDPYTAVAGSCAAMYGPAHGGASALVVKMLEEIENINGVQAYVDRVKEKKSILYGFGHWKYNTYDPRSKLIKSLLQEALELCGSDGLFEVAMELERVATADEYFTSRGVYPNVDFYTGLIYRALGFPEDYFVVLSTLPRAAGWLAHWLEGLRDKQSKIFRPRQDYVGEDLRDYVPIDERKGKESDINLQSFVSTYSRRRMVNV